MNYNRYPRSNKWMNSFFSITLRQDVFVIWEILHKRRATSVWLDTYTGRHHLVFYHSFLPLPLFLCTNTSVLPDFRSRKASKFIFFMKAACHWHCIQCPFALLFLPFVVETMKWKRRGDSWKVIIALLCSFNQAWVKNIKSRSFFVIYYFIN